ncbi:hypothetical protein VTH06DRAFT_1309 [Thermothelomyces fergusii]
MARDLPTFLTIPLELRLEIYSHLLVLPPPPPRESLGAVPRCSFAASRGLGSTETQSKPTLHPQILRVNRQIYEEALPILYGQNTFSAHPVYLTARPSLYYPYCSPCRPLTTMTPARAEYDPKSPLSTRAPGAEGRKSRREEVAVTNPNIRLIRKWHIRVRLDTPRNPALGASPSAPSAPSPGDRGGDNDASPSSPSSTSPTAAAAATNNNNNNNNNNKPATPSDGETSTADANPIAAAFSNAESLTLDLWRGVVFTTITFAISDSGDLVVSSEAAAETAAGTTTTTTTTTTISTRGGREGEGAKGGDDDDDDDKREERRAETGPAALRPFEDVRGVRHVRIVGATTGIEGYLGWLQERMTMPPTATAVSG